MARLILPGLILVSALPAFQESVWPQAADLPIIEIPVPLHFLDASGDTVKLPPGTYRVEADGPVLKLLRDDPTHPPAVFIAAQSGVHEETLKETTVKIGPDKHNPDLYHLAALLTDGTGFEAVGSKSGVQARGTEYSFIRARIFSTQP